MPDLSDVDNDVRSLEGEVGKYAARTVQEFEDVLSDDRQLAAMFRNGRPLPEFGEFVQGYVNAITADGSIGDQVRDEVAAAVSSMLGDRKAVNRVPIGGGGIPQPRAGQGAVYNKRAPGAKVDSLFTSRDTLMADVFNAIWHKGPQTGPMADLREKLRVTNLGSIVPADGGFLVPEQLRVQIISKALESSIIRPLATVLPMESLRLAIPMADATTNVGSVFGGLVGYWTEEAATLVESSPSLARIQLDAHKLTVRCDVPNELLADSTACQAFLELAMPQTAAFFEDLAFMFGTGVGEPYGLLRSDNPGQVIVAKESGQAAATILWANIVKMYSRMLPSSL